MPLRQDRPRTPFPFMELDELAQIHILQCLAPRDIQSARLTCSYIQNLVDFEVGVNVVTPKFNILGENSVQEYEKMGETLFKKKVRGLQLSQSPVRSSLDHLFESFHQPNHLRSISLTGTKFQWLEAILTRCKNLRKLTYYTLKTTQRQPYAETRPKEIIEGFRDSPIQTNKLESLTVKLSSRTNDYLCPMFLLLGGIKNIFLHCT